jgi:hypothetical protein
MDEGENAIRKAARRRSALVPGTGFALLGNPRAAGLGLALTALGIASVAVVSFWPGRLTSGLTLACILASIVFWAVESIATGRIVIHPSGEASFLSRHFMGACALTYIFAIAASACIIVNFGALILRGEEIVPLAYPGERILYHKHVEADDLVPGRLIAFRVSGKSTWGQPGAVIMGRILAAPGDAIAIRGPRYLVNGSESVEVSTTSGYRVVLEIPESPAQLIVPADCFFVVQEQPSKALDSRTLSWAQREDVLATRFWLISLRALGQTLR